MSKFLKKVPRKNSNTFFFFILFLFKFSTNLQKDFLKMLKLNAHKTVYFFFSKNVGFRFIDSFLCSRYVSLYRGVTLYAEVLVNLHLVVFLCPHNLNLCFFMSNIKKYPDREIKKIQRNHQLKLLVWLFRSMFWFYFIFNSNSFNVQ